MTRSITNIWLTLVVLVGLYPITVGAQGASPTPGMAVSPRLHVTVDRGQLPGEQGFIIFGRQTFQPASQRTFDSPGVIGTEALLVESGELTVEIPGADGRILRGAGSGAPREEAAPAATPFTLAAGDALVYPLQKHIESNDEDAPAVFYFAAILEPSAPPEPDPSDIGEATTEFLGQSSSAWPDLPLGPVTISIEPEQVAAGQMLPAPAGGIQAISQTSGDASALMVADNGVLNLATEPVELLVVALAPDTAMTATPAASPVPRMTSPASPPERLLATTFPAARLPQGSAAVEFWRSTWEPGFEYLATEYHPSVSVGGDLVLSGEWAARSDGDILVWRNGRIEDAPLNQEVVLRPGEAVIYLDNAANEWLRNASDATTETANFAITLGEDYQGPNLGVDWEQSGLSGHDVTVTIDRQTLAPGEALLVTPDMSAPAVRIVDAGTLEWVLRGSDGQEAATPLRFGQGAVVPFAMPAEGGQIALRSGGNEPLVLLTMTMTRAEEAVATPAS
jgi:hypothetical protein